MDQHYAVVGLVFGDEGKGAAVDWLCSEFGGNATVVRFSGGAQAAHNVIADGKHHTFRQFGSGTFTGARTFLSKHMMVEPILLAHEADVLRRMGVHEDPLSLITIDPDALITTEFHRAANRTREDLRSGKHGSTGNGIGETTFYNLACLSNAPKGSFVGNFELYADAPSISGSITVWDTMPGNERMLRSKLQDLSDFYHPLISKGSHMLPSVNAVHSMLVSFGQCVAIDRAASALAGVEHLVFEGSQGALLDQKHGFLPFVTWSNTLPDNARALADELGIDLHVMGITRSYTTRHGAGPLPAETDLGMVEPHNGTGKYQGSWRDSPLDLPLLRRGIELCQPDSVMITHMDREHHDGVTGYTLGMREIRNITDSTTADELMNVKPIFGVVDIMSEMRKLGVNVSALAYGPDRNHRTWVKQAALT